MAVSTSSRSPDHPSSRLSLFPQHSGLNLELLDLDEPARSDGGFLAGLVGGLDYAVSRAVTLTGSLHSSAIFFGGGRKGAGREMRIGVRVKP